MSRAPKEPLDALNLAAAATVVERDYCLANFVRLAERLAAPGGAAHARMVFRSVDGLPTAELQVRAPAVLICQRCLGPMRQTLESTSKLVFVVSEDAAVPEDHEAIAGDPRRVDIAELVEDELLLSLPLVATHGAGDDCATPGPRVPGDAVAEPSAQELRRPFAGLKELLKH